MSNLIYIAGPYTADTHLGVEANILAARKAAVWCAEHNVYFICPHLNTAHFELWAPEVVYGFYLNMDFEILARCDALIVLPGWGKSRGSLEEILLANKMQIPVFYYPEDCDAVVSFAEKGEHEESLYRS